MSYEFKKGATSQSIEVYIVDSTNGTPETGVLWNTAGIDLKYRRKDAVAVSITEAALTTPALTDTWESGGFLEIGNGVYRLDLPDAALAVASGIDRVVVFGTVTGMVVMPVTIHLTDVDSIGAASGGSANINITEDNTGGAIDPSSATFVGSVQGATTFANLEAEDGVVHDIDDTGNDIDIVYGASVGGGRIGSKVAILANVSGNADEIKVKAYDHVGADWEIIGTVEGSGGSTAKALELDLLLKHTGTGAELGKVYIRFETDSTTPSNLSIDKLLIRTANIGQSVGYANGRIWVDTSANGVAGTEAFVNGVADNPVNLIASAKNLSTSVGVMDFHIINGSTITLAESTTNESYFGDNWTLALGGQDVDGAYFQGAHVSGIGTSATEVHYEGCDVGTMSVQIGHFDFCAFSGTVTMTLAGDYEFHNCYSNVAGAGAPTFTKTAGQAITAEWRNWMDSITVSGLQSGDTITINGRLGTVTLNGADATVEIRGSYKSIVNNLTGSPTVNTDGAWQGSDIEDILADTNETQGKHPTNKFMGSSDGADDDGNLNAIKVVTDWQRSCEGTVVVNNPGTDTIFDLTAVIGTLSTNNDSCKNMVITFFDISGSVYETRKVTALVGASGRVTIDFNLTFPVDDGVDTFILWNKYSPTAAAGGGATAQEVHEYDVSGITTEGQAGYEIQKRGGSSIYNS